MKRVLIFVIMLTLTACGSNSLPAQERGETQVSNISKTPTDIPMEVIEDRWNDILFTHRFVIMACQTLSYASERFEEENGDFEGFTDLFRASQHMLLETNNYDNPDQMNFEFDWLNMFKENISAQFDVHDAYLKGDISELQIEDNLDVLCTSLEDDWNEETWKNDALVMGVTEEWTNFTLDKVDQETKNFLRDWIYENGTNPPP